MGVDGRRGSTCKGICDHAWWSLNSIPEYSWRRTDPYKLSSDLYTYAPPHVCAQNEQIN